MCRSKKKNHGTRLHNLQTYETENEVPPAYILFNISGKKETLLPAKVESLLQGKSFIFEVDSGAFFSSMPLYVFNSVKEYFLF